MPYKNIVKWDKVHHFMRSFFPPSKTQNVFCYYGSVKLFRSLLLTLFSLNMNQVYGKDVDYFLKSQGDNLNYFIQTSASLGIFKEKTTRSTITTEQNSPMTISGGISYFPNAVEKVSFIAMGSLSYLVPSDFEHEGGSVFSNNLKLDPEYGASMYVHKSYTHRNSTGFFGGIDYESFNLYNASSLLIGESPTLVTERISYATLGLTFAKKIVTPFVLNISASQSLTTQREFRGQRYQIVWNQKYSENTWYHIFAKRHELNDGHRNLTITRYGVGVGFYY